jgi:hypothetical protein
MWYEKPHSGASGACGTVALRIPFTPPILSARSYPLQYARLFAFKLLVTLQISLAKIDGELQVLAVDAAISADSARADAEQAFPNG